MALEKALDFSIADWQGNEFDLSIYLGQKNLFPFFNRGVVYRTVRAHMAQLRQDYSLLKKK
jgi:hypothetical protein